MRRSGQGQGCNALARRRHLRRRSTLLRMNVVCCMSVSVPCPPYCTVQELQSVVVEREEQLSQRDGEVQQLQAHVARMLGLPASEARALTAAAVPQQQPAPDEWGQRVADLEAANERLEQALVQANSRGGAASPGPPAGGCDTEDGDAVAALTIQLAEREGQLQAARQQVEELEALQHLARVRTPGVGMSGGSSKGG